MQKILFITLLFTISIVSYSQNIYDSIYVGNRWRTYMTHLPTGYNPAIKYPLVLCFHGGQNGAQSSQLGWQAVAYMSKLSQKADSAGFIVVYPEGTVINNNRTWNAGGCCQPATNNNINDVSFVNQLIDTLKYNYPIDSLRVYASGSSNGAMLCFRLACEIPNKIAAIAIISGAQEYFPCNPSRKMPVINFHSKVDIAVPYNGGVGQGPSGTNFTSQDSTMNLWTSINNCTTRDTVVNGTGANDIDTNYTYIRIHNCSCNAEFHHYATSDGGHSWPSGNPNNNPVSFQVNATDLLWDFFQNYTISCSVLPLKLLFFQANQNDNNVTLLWQTTEEINTSHFIVQSSLDGINFNEVGKLKANSNTNPQNNYSFVDKTEIQNQIYYRLKIVDKDGHTEYSKVIVVKKNSLVNSIKVYPNPTQNNLLVKVTNNKIENTFYSITDLRGRIIKLQDLILSVGVNTFSLNTSFLNKGTYILKIGTDKYKKQLFVKD